MKRNALGAFAVAILVAMVACDDGGADGDADLELDASGDADGDADADDEPPLGQIGDACTVNGQCASAFCIPEVMLPEIRGGYCSELCELDEPDDCGDDALCVDIGLGVPFCMKQCSEQSDCRDDWDCVGVCFPGQDVAEVAPTDRLDPSDDVLSAAVEAVDQARLRAHIEVLSGAAEWDSPDGRVTISSRNVFHPDHALAVSYLVETLSGFGLEVAEEPFDWSVEEGGERLRGRGVNISARLEGSDPELEPVFITAHYDSIANFTTGEWDATVDPAPGAVDNASGVAIVLELAQVLSELAETDPAPRTLVFLLFDVEELGMVGSFAYVEEMPASEAPLCSLNIDMVGWDLELWPGRFWYAFNPLHPDMAAFDLEAMTELVPEASPILSDATDSMMFGGSDHLPFWEEGLCATYFSNWPIVGVYHTTGDLVETYDWPLFLDVARSAAAVYAAWGYRWE
jgi:hypothetical protein